MKLSEIAEYIVDNYSDCCMAYNNEVIKGCREEWYEEILIEPLLDFYMYEKMGLCGCGSPEDTYEVIRRYLHIRKARFRDDLSYDLVKESYNVNLHMDYDDSIQYGMLQFLAYVLDSYGFTTHGGGIGGCWLTEDGERLLTVLDAWYESGGCVNE